MAGKLAVGAYAGRKVQSEEMNARSEITTVLAGGTPDHTPFTVYWGDHVGEDRDRWMRLVDKGLGISRHCWTVKRVEHGVEDTSEERTEGDRHYEISRKKTGVGTIQSVKLNRRCIESWVKEPADYRVVKWITENTELVCQYEDFEKSEEIVGDNGISIVTGSRSPAMNVNIEWAGTERFCMDIAMEVDELLDLYEAQKTLFMEETRLIANGPGRHVKWFENLSCEMLGPVRYDKLLLSVYNEAVPLLVASGKEVMVHYDGALRAIADRVAVAPFHVVESLTEPPEGDMTYDECRGAWPDKALWGNINLGLYSLPEGELREAVIAMRERAGKRGFAFEVSEDMPDNWEEVFPVVLETLAALG